MDKKKIKKKKFISLQNRNKLNNLNAKEWIVETISVWNQKGLGAKHPDTKIEKEHPAPFSYTDVTRLIKFFTKKNQVVLDPFLGIGSTLKACALSGREGIGIELNKRYVELSQKRLDGEVSDLFANKKQKIIHGDSFKVLDVLEDDSIDFVVTSPPYWNILHKKDHKVRQEREGFGLDTQYSDLTEDLGNINNYDEFLDKLTDILIKCERVLKSNKYMTVIVSDFRNKDKYVMFHSDLVSKLQHSNFVLKGLKVLYQRHKRVFPYGYPFSYVPNIHHQYIIILQNKK